jgi:hypothetical protein
VAQQGSSWYQQLEQYQQSPWIPFGRNIKEAKYVSSLHRIKTGFYDDHSKNDPGESNGTLIHKCEVWVDGVVCYYERNYHLEESITGGHQDEHM